MVPTVELPPVVPLTCHVTAVLVAFVTVAVNCVVAPRRVEAAPATVTVVAGGVVVPPPPPPDIPPLHPARANEVSARTNTPGWRRAKQPDFMGASTRVLCLSTNACACLMGETALSKPCFGP